VKNLERLLGQRTLEVAILKDKLGLPGSGVDIDE